MSYSPEERELLRLEEVIDALQLKLKAADKVIEAARQVFDEMYYEGLGMNWGKPSNNSIANLRGKLSDYDSIKENRD